MAAKRLRLSDTARLGAGVALASLAAWVWLLTRTEMSCHVLSRASGISLGALFASVSVPSAALGWLMMLVAMMAPMTMPALSFIRSSSFASRRGRMSAFFLAGYALVWMGVGVGMTAFELVLRWILPGSWLPALALGLVALIWQASPVKQRCLNRCHSHRPLPAFGWEADWGALRMGLVHGGWCVGSCWALMLLPMLLPVGHEVGMLAVAVLMFCERLDPPRVPAWRLRGLGTARGVLRMWLFGPRRSALLARAERSP